MSRFKLIFLTLTAAASLSLFAQEVPRPFQDHLGPNYPNSPSPSTAAEPAFFPATQPDPKFPLRVQITQNDAIYNTTTYVFHGKGTLQLLGLQPTQLGFHYTCGHTFHGLGSNIEARWQPPGHKLQLLLQDPATNKLHTCTLTTTPTS